jgi:hypothetical protein
MYIVILLKQKIVYTGVVYMYYQQRECKSGSVMTHRYVFLCWDTPGLKRIQERWETVIRV